MDETRTALSHLLPTVPLPYPQSLVTTAAAIRDKSRSKIQLRPEEEPSRAWLAAWLAAERLGTTLNLPLPQLHKHAPITIPLKNFKRLLGTFKASIPENITSPRKTRGVTAPDVIKEIVQLCTKTGSTISQSYLAKTVEPLRIIHPRKESLQLLIAATFLVVCSWKDGAQQKITPPQKKKVVEAYDEQFTGKEVTEWIRVVEGDLEDLKWFERFPVPSSGEPQKRKADGEISNGIKAEKLVKNISGIGNMVQPEISFGVDRLAQFDDWREGIMEKVRGIEKART